MAEALKTIVRETIPTGLNAIRGVNEKNCEEVLSNDKKDDEKLFNLFFKIWSTGISYEDFLQDLNIYSKQLGILQPKMDQMIQYFIMKGTPKIEFISAANKLKMFMTRKKTTYTERKIESVEVTKELLEKLPQFEKYKGCLEKNKKKDDLADCFLQGIYYLTLKKMINIEY